MLLMDDLVAAESDKKKSNRDVEDYESSVPPRTLKQLVAHRDAGKVPAHEICLSMLMYDTPVHP